MGNSFSGMLFLGSEVSAKQLYDLIVKLKAKGFLEVPIKEELNKLVDTHSSMNIKLNYEYKGSKRSARIYYIFTAKDEIYLEFNNRDGGGSLVDSFIELVKVFLDVFDVELGFLDNENFFDDRPRSDYFFSDIKGFFKISACVTIMGPDLIKKFGRKKLALIKDSSSKKVKNYKGFREEFYNDYFIIKLYNYLERETK